ncbi:MAG: GTP 3',8-cyclase MoaA [Lachnospiraceae bacterium]
MQDGQGRKIEYLRISVTDRCNLRCQYCMPQGGVELMKHCEILSLEEFARIVRIMAGMGLKKVRFTGGEPMVKRNLVKLVKDVADTDGIKTVAMTTNGTIFSGYVDELKAAGLTNVNISLDTTDAKVFEKITGSDEYDKVFGSIEKSKAAGLKVKINCVPCREFNENDIIGIASIAKDMDVDVRFIELMPIGCGANYTGIPGDEILGRLKGCFGEYEQCGHESTDGPSRYVKFKGFKGRIGFIEPMSHKFCSECNRVRLTADGRLKLCLYHKDGIDLKTLLRTGKSDDEIKDAINAALKDKPKEHDFGNPVKLDKRKMSQIGG